ncbi:hypothetical protein [Pseudomonas sp.]|uniref:hypothetical protein n=1 Tax=Pseudomonas sp. TaxID=306 RepID=UPI00286B5FD9|nr:hypothetical protein [Pseudomonas sp.]
MSTDEQLLEQSPARFCSPALEQSLIDIPGAVQLTDSADVGINRRLARGNMKGMAIIVPPTKVFAGDRVEIFICHRDSSTAPLIWFVVPNDYQGGPFLRRIPANDIPEGISRWFYRVNNVESAHLKVLVITVQPGGIDPQPEYPGHRLLRAPQISPLIIDGTVDVTVTIAPWQGMRCNDIVSLQFINWRIEHKVAPEEIGQPVTLLITTKMIEADGSGQALLQYEISDEVRNMASDHSIGLLVDIKKADQAQRLPAPKISKTDSDNAIYMTALGADSVSVTLATNSPPFTATDVVELNWRGEPRDGPVQLFTKSQTVASQKVLTLTVPNAVIQRLADGFACVEYIRISASGERHLSKYVQVFVVGNTRRID